VIREYILASSCSTEIFHIVDSYMSVNKNIKGTRSCISIRTKFALTRHRIVCVYVACLLAHLFCIHPLEKCVKMQKLYSVNLNENLFGCKYQPRTRHEGPEGE